MKMTSKIGISIMVLLGALLAGPHNAPAEEDDTIYLAQYRRGAPAPGLSTDTYTDRKNGYSIIPPGGWYQDSKTRRFLVRFSSRDYHAFLMVDAVPVEKEVKLDTELIDFITAQTDQVKKKINTFQVLNSANTTLNRQPAYLTEASFTAGPNLVLMNIYYIPAGKVVYMVTFTYPEAEKNLYERVLKSSAGTFAVLP